MSPLRGRRFWGSIAWLWLPSAKIICRPFIEKFPNFPLPVARLARLAVDLKYQRQGVGELLLANALSRCLDLSDEIGMVGVIVDAKNETAQRFYERFEFDLLVDSPLTLWIPFSALTQLK